jgi:hypothetical protein
MQMIKRLLLVTGLLAAAVTHAHAYPAHYYGYYNPGAVAAGTAVEGLAAALGGYAYRPPPPVYYVPPVPYYPPVVYPGYGYRYYYR